MGFLERGYKQHRCFARQVRQIEVPHVSPLALIRPIDLAPLTSSTPLIKGSLGLSQLIPKRRFAVSNGAGSSLLQPGLLNANSVGFKIPSPPMSSKRAQTLELREGDCGETDDRRAATNRLAGTKQLALGRNPSERGQRAAIYAIAAHD